jgi:CBS domain containing-hemolysin-like protein
VIFACVHNAGRSQMAAAFFNGLADPARARALSAGTQPGECVHPEVLQAMREKGDRRGAIIRGLRANTSRLLAVILIGQNLFMSAASASATTLAEHWFGPRYGILIAVAFSTLTLFVFAEMVPKAIAAASPVSVSRAVAVPLSWMMKLLSPVAEICVKMTNRALRLFGVAEHRPGLTEEELKSVFNLGADEGVIHRGERQLLHKIIEFGDKTVRDIMVPRTKIVALPETASFQDVQVVLREHKFSRLPVSAARSTTCGSCTPRTSST